jgi:hypothetical protein
MNRKFPKETVNLSMVRRAFLHTYFSHFPNQTISSVSFTRAQICKRLRSPGFDSKESTPLGWESMLGLRERFTNSGSVCARAGRLNLVFIVQYTIPKRTKKFIPKKRYDFAASYENTVNMFIGF